MSEPAPQPTIEALTVGQAAERTRVVSAADLDAFAAVSGDAKALRFKHAVRIGDVATARVEVIEMDEAAGHAVLSTRCLVRGKVMAEGEAVVRLPRAGRGAR